MDILPEVLERSMLEEFVYAAAKELVAPDLPAYVEGSYYYPDDYALDLSDDEVWQVLAKAHDFWRGQLAVISMMTSEECYNSTNAFARLELAGPATYQVWAGHLVRLFERLEPPRQHPLSFRVEEIFLKHRRELAENARIVGKGDLYCYVADPRNDVLGLSLNPNCPAAGRVARSVYQRTYYEPESGYSYRLTRQIITANGGLAPIDW